MSNKYGVLITECPASFPHKAHNWREGFLWLRKRTCQGLTQEEVDAVIPEESHKHHFVLYPMKPTDIKMVFGCAYYCPTRSEIRMTREYYRRMVLEGYNPWP